MHMNETQKEMALVILDRGTIPGDILDHYGILRDAGFSPDDIAANYDAAAEYAFQTAVRVMNLANPFGVAA